MRGSDDSLEMVKDGWIYSCTKQLTFTTNGNFDSARSGVGGRHKMHSLTSDTHTQAWSIYQPRIANICMQSLMMIKNEPIPSARAVL